MTKKAAMPAIGKSPVGGLYPTLPVEDLSGGLNADNPGVIADNEIALGSQNIEFTPERKIIPRHGILKRYTADFGPDPVLGMGAFYKSDGTTRLVIAAGTTIYQDTPHLVFGYETQAEWQATGAYTNCAVSGPTAGYETGGASPSTDISAGPADQFQIAVDTDAAGGTPAYKNVTLTLTGLTTGALIAAEMQTEIRALGGIYAAVTVAYTTVYIITSGTTGTGSMVRVTSGLGLDVAAALKIGVINGATDTDGVAATVKMNTPPSPTFARASVAYDDSGVQYASGVPRYEALSSVHTENTQATFQTGTLTDVVATATADLELAKTGTDYSNTVQNTADFTGTQNQTQAISNSEQLVGGTGIVSLGASQLELSVLEAGYSFTVGTLDIVATGLRVYVAGSSTWTVNLWRVSDQALIASTVVTSSGTISDWFSASITPVILSANTSYIVSCSFKGGNQYKYAIASSTSSSLISLNSGQTGGADGVFPNTADNTYIYGADIVIGFLSGTYTHVAQDVSGAGVCNSATLTFAPTTPANTAVTVDYRISTDGGSTWGGWVTNIASGATIIAKGTNLTGYRVQWRANLSTTDTSVTPSITDIVVTVTSGYYSSGNRITPSISAYVGPLVSTAISWAATTPANTAVAVQISWDGGTTWLACTSGSALPGTPTASYLIKELLTTTDVAATPQLTSLTVTITGQQGVMSEEGATNLLTANQSNVETDTTGFTASAAGTTVSRDTSTFWQGTASLKMVCDGTAAGQGEFLGITAAANTPYTASVWAKGAGTMQLVMNGAAITTVTGPVITLTDVFTRYSITGTTNASGGALYFAVWTNSAQAVTFWVDGLQIEAKSYPTSWITGASTRAAETLTIPTANVFTKGSWAVEMVYKPKDAITQPSYLFLWEVEIDSSNRYALILNPTGDLYLAVVSGGVEIDTAKIALSLGSSYAIMIAGDGSHIRLCVNGVQVGSDVAYTESVGTLPANMAIGYSALYGGLQADGPITDLRISSRPRTLAEHQAYVNSGLPQAWDVDTTCLLSFNGNMTQPATRQSVWQSPVQDAVASQWPASLAVNWLDDVPANTAVIGQTRTSADGATWSPWYEQVSGDPAQAPPNGYSQIRFILEETDGSSTPTLTQATATYDGAPNIAALEAGLSGAQAYDFDQLADNLVIANGVDLPRKYDGTTISTITAAPAAALARTYQNRMWLARTANNPNRLYLSDIGSPGSWPAINFIDVNPGDGDRIMSLIAQPTTLLLSKGRAKYFLQGATTSNFSISNAGAGGSISQRGTQWTPYGVFEADQEGVWATDFRTRKRLSLKLDKLWKALQGYYMRTVAVFYFDDKLMVTGPYQVIQNDTVFLFDLNLKNWAFLEGWNPACFLPFYTSSGVKYLFGSSLTGNVFQIGDLPTDAGAAFTATVKTKQYSLTSPDVVNRLKWVDFNFLGGTIAQSVTVTPYVDGVAGTAKTFTVLGNQTVQAFRMWLQPIGNTVQFKIDMTGASYYSVVFLGFTLTYYPRAVRPTRVV